MHRRKRERERVGTGKQYFISAAANMCLAHVRTFYHAGIHPVVALHILGGVSLYHAVPICIGEKFLLLAPSLYCCIRLKLLLFLLRKLLAFRMQTTR